jgi:hypothetical protein
MALLMECHTVVQMNGRKAVKMLLQAEWNQQHGKEFTIKDISRIMTALGLQQGVLTSGQVGTAFSAPATCTRSAALTSTLERDHSVTQKCCSESKKHMHQSVRKSACRRSSWQP